MLNLNPKKFEVIPHGICPKIRTEGKKTNLRDSKIVKILFVGRLEHRKGFDILVRSIPKIIESFSDIHIDICGTGELLEIAKSDLLPSHLSKISFHGYQRPFLGFFYLTVSDLIYRCVFDTHVHENIC